MGQPAAGPSADGDGKARPRHTEPAAPLYRTPRPSPSASAGVRPRVADISAADGEMSSPRRVLTSPLPQAPPAVGGNVSTVTDYKKMLAYLEKQNKLHDIQMIIMQQYEKVRRKEDLARLEQITGAFTQDECMQVYQVFKQRGADHIEEIIARGQILSDMQETSSAPPSASSASRPTKRSGSSAPRPATARSSTPSATPTRKRGRSHGPSTTSKRYKGLAIQPIYTQREFPPHRPRDDSRSSTPRQKKGEADEEEEEEEEEGSEGSEEDEEDDEQAGSSEDDEQAGSSEGTRSHSHAERYPSWIGPLTQDARCQRMYVHKYTISRPKAKGNGKFVIYPGQQCPRKKHSDTDFCSTHQVSKSPRRKA